MTPSGAAVNMGTQAIGIKRAGSLQRNRPVTGNALIYPSQVIEVERAEQAGITVTGTP